MRIITPGIHSLLQDSGRFGYHNLGLTTGGPMDTQAYYWANRLCDNPTNATAIEIAVGGLKVQVNAPTRVAITGAQVPITLNGVAMPNWQTLPLRAGDELQLGFSQRGCRSYLAVDGGFHIAPQFGSSSTVVREGIGGLNGQALQAGDLLQYDASSLTECWQLAEEYRPLYSRHITLRVVLGYQHQQFSQQQKDTLFHNAYQVSKLSDRMGYRLTGPKIPVTAKGMLSEGIALGAIQIPADGQPIVLLNDRQTIGGYPKIGSVLSLDLGLLAQLMPGDKVSFAAIDAELALQIVRNYHQRLAGIPRRSVSYQSDHHPLNRLQELSKQLEDVLVARNPRGMQTLQQAMPSGYYARALNILTNVLQGDGSTLSTPSSNHSTRHGAKIIIGTGFPVAGTFETDGPVGAMALYHCLVQLGAEPTLVCIEPLARALQDDYRVAALTANDPTAAQGLFHSLEPDLIIAIELPGQAADGHYYNMRGDDISQHCACFDELMQLAQQQNCPTIPTIAIGDGGNEIGMGNLVDAVTKLNITPCVTGCDQLLIADVSNWAALGLMAMLSQYYQQDFLAQVNTTELLSYLSHRGSVDGVTKENTLTEDGLPASEGQSVIAQLQGLLKF